MPDQSSVRPTASAWMMRLAHHVVGTDRQFARLGGVVGDADAAEVRVDQDAGRQGAQDAADAVDAEDVQRVVVAEGVLHRGAHHEADHAGDEAEHDRAHRAGEARGRGDGHEAGDRARQHAEQGRLALERPLGEQPRHRGGAGRHEGVEHGERGRAVGLEVRAGVEAEPADPQQRGADHRHGQGVRGEQVTAVADALAHDQAADEARDSSVDVHHGAAAKSRAPFWNRKPASLLTASSAAWAVALEASSVAAASALAALPTASGPPQYQPCGPSGSRSP